MPEYLNEIRKIIEAFHSGHITMGEFKDRIGKLWRRQAERLLLRPENKEQERSPSQTIRSGKSKEKATGK